MIVREVRAGSASSGGHADSASCGACSSKWMEDGRSSYIRSHLSCTVTQVLLIVVNLRRKEDSTVCLPQLLAALLRCPLKRSHCASFCSCSFVLRPLLRLAAANIGERVLFINCLLRQT